MQLMTFARPKELNVGDRRVFQSPYEEFAARNGEICFVTKVFDKDDDEHDISEVGTMYAIQFERDGENIEAWPEELERAAN